MRLIKVLLVVIGILCQPIDLCAQNNVHEQLYQSMLLEQAGEHDRVISVVPALLMSEALSPQERGRGWVLLGAAYQAKGDFAQAQSSYDRAIRIFEGDESFAEDYAATLKNYAGLYRDLWQSSSAIKVLEKTIPIYKKLGNHSGLASSYAMLGELELNLDHRRKSSEYLSQALEEAKLANETNDDLMATISSTQAWLALKEGDARAAISGYEHAVELWQHKHGEEHSLTGWGYVLLGKAYAQIGQDSNALAKMSKGIDILRRSVGEGNPQFLVAEDAYARLLDRSGEHAKASVLKKNSQMGLANLYHGKCVSCQISILALR